MTGQKPVVKEFLLNGAEGDIFCDLFSFEASAEMDSLGALFVLAELRGAPKAAWGVPNLITSAMRRTYYEKADRKPAHAFTLALKEANEVLMHELSSGNEGWLGASSFVACVLTDQGIYASRAGSNAVGIWLIRSGARTDVFSADSKGVAPFSSLVSGKIEASDILCAGSSSAFSGIISNTSDIQEMYRAVHKKTTERSASCAIVITIPAKEISANALAPLLNATLHPRNISPLNPLHHASHSLLVTQKFFQWGSGTLGKSGNKIIRMLGNLSFMGKVKRYVHLPALISGALPRSLGAGIALRWIAPKKSVIVGILLIGMGFGIIKTGAQVLNHIQNKPAPSTSAASELGKKLEQAHAAMIYGDKKQAVQLLEETHQGIQLLAQQKTSASLLASLSASWQEIENQVFAIKTIPSQTILTLKGFPISFTPTGIYSAIKSNDNQVLSFTDNNVGALYRFSLKDKKGSIILRSEKSGFVGLLPTWASSGHAANPKYLYAVGKDGITLFDQNAENFASTLPYEHNENITFAVAAEASALLGDIQNGQIWKVALDKDALQDPSAWLKKPEKNTLSKVIDASSDGKGVWLLRNDGIVSRYVNGVRIENITLSGVQKDFHADRIEIIGAPNPSLLVLDSNAGVIARFTGKGTLQTQYVNKDIVHAKDFTLSADTNAAYVLVGNNVQKLILN